MSSSILDMLSQQLGGDAVTQLSRQLGADEGTTESQERAGQNEEDDQAGEALPSLQYGKDRSDGEAGEGADASGDRAEAPAEEEHPLDELRLIVEVIKDEGLVDTSALGDKPHARSRQACLC